MSNDFYIVSKDLLPDYVDKVIEARELLRSGKARNVSEAARLCGISRSTYYKYRDKVFESKAENSSRRLVISVLLKHEPGTLGRVLSHMSKKGVNIITINQNPPIAGRASVIISMDISVLKVKISALLDELGEIEGVDNPTIIDIS